MSERMPPKHPIRQAKWDCVEVLNFISIYGNKRTVATTAKGNKENQAIRVDCSSDGGSGAASRLTADPDQSEVPEVTVYKQTVLNAARTIFS